MKKDLPLLDDPSGDQSLDIIDDGANSAVQTDRIFHLPTDDIGDNHYTGKKSFSYIILT
jgi:hypothetical protein